MNVRASGVDGINFDLVDIEAQDVDPFAGELQAERQADVAQADNGEGRFQGSGLRE